MNRITIGITLLLSLTVPLTVGYFYYRSIIGSAKKELDKEITTEQLEQLNS